MTAQTLPWDIETSSTSHGPVQNDPPSNAGGPEQEHSSRRAESSRKLAEKALAGGELKERRVDGVTGEQPGGRELLTFRMLRMGAISSCA
jgi:hypothetical protein